MADFSLEALQGELTRRETQPWTLPRADKVNPELRSRFESMAQDYYQQTGVPLRVSDSFRSHEEQADVYRRKPNLAAKPGNSRHEIETGAEALDLDQSQVAQVEKLGLLDKHGFVRPVLSKGETWHIELPRMEKAGKLAAKIPGGGVTLDDLKAELSRREAADTGPTLEDLKGELARREGQPAPTTEAGAAVTAAAMGMQPKPTAAGPTSPQQAAQAFLESGQPLMNVGGKAIKPWGPESPVGAPVPSAPDQDPISASPEAKAAQVPLPVHKFMPWLKEGMIDTLSRWGSLVEPTATAEGAMSDMKPTTQKERYEAAHKGMSKEWLPEGPVSADNAEEMVMKGAISSIPTLIELLGYGSATGGVGGAAMSFGMQAATSPDATPGSVAKSAVLGKALSFMHSLTGKLADPVAQWTARITGGAGLGGGAAALEGGKAEDIGKQAALFAMFETMGMPKIEKLRELGLDNKDAGIIQDTLETGKVTKEVAGIADKILRVPPEPRSTPETPPVTPQEAAGAPVEAKSTPVPREAPVEPGATPEAVIPPTVPQAAVAPVVPEPKIATTPLSQEVIDSSPDLAGGGEVPGDKEFRAKFGSKQGKPEGLLTSRQPQGKGANLQKALERNDLAAIVMNHGGFDPKTIKDYVGTPEKRQMLGRKVLRNGGIAPDVLFSELQSSHPDQFGHFENVDDMMRYFVDGRHEKFLNKGVLQSEHQILAEEAEYDRQRLGLSPEEFAELEREAEREIQSEAAIGAGGEDFFAEAAAESPLKAGKAKPSKFDARLNELQDEYPDLNRERASEVLRTLPEAANHQIAAMSADPEMFAQVSKGNLTAQIKAELLSRSSDKVQDRALPGIGTGGLFEEPAPAAKKGLGEEGFVDIKPLLDVVEQTRKGTKPLLFPGAKSKEHFDAAVVFGSKLGTHNRMTEQATAELRPISKVFEKEVHKPGLPLTENVGMKFGSAMMQPNQPVEARFQQTKTQVNRGFAQRVEMLDKAGAPLETVRENYFPGMWTRDSIRAFNQALDEYISKGNVIPNNDILLLGARERTTIKNRVDELLESGQGSDKDHLQYLTKRPMKGKESFRKEKVFDDIKDPIEFGLQPFSNNPIDWVRLKYAEMDRSIMANRAFREYESKGDLVNVDNSGRPLKGRKKGEPPPEPLSRDEWEKIKDRYGEIWMRDPKTHMLTKVGERWAKKPVADIINGYLSQSLYNSPYFVGTIFRGTMAVGNFLNQSQLGWGSLFHVGFTGIETQISQNAELLKDIYGIAKGNRTAKQLATTTAKVPVAMFRTGFQGSKVVGEWRSPTMNIPTDVPVRQILVTKPQGGVHKVNDKATRVALIAKALELGGGHLIMERGLQTQQTEKMVRDWYSGHKFKAALRSPVALSEIMMKPVMYWVVPRQKAGVFGELAGRIIEQNPDKTLEQLRPKFRQAWSRVDARLGQVGYDRLFMNNIAKNVIQALIRSPGWSGGTIAEVGGSGKDAAKFLVDWAKAGEAPSDLPDRVAYTIALMATIMGANSILTYAFTGEKPWESKTPFTDLWAFRDGGKDKYGNPTRWLLPSYAKDIYAYWENWSQTLLNKSHPLISAGSELWKGVNYYNEQFIDPADKFMKRQWDRIKHIPTYFEPFWTRGARKAGEQSGGVLKTLKKSPGKIVAPEFGVMPATRAYTQTEADKVMDQYFARKSTVKSPKEAKIIEERRNVENLGYVGKESPEKQVEFKGKLKEMREAGKITSRQSRNIETKVQDAKVYRFKNVKDIDVEVATYRAGTPEEQALYGPILKKRINNLRDRDFQKYKKYRDVKKEIEEVEAGRQTFDIDTELKRREAR